MKKLWEWLTGNVIKEIGQVLDELITTEEEKLNDHPRLNPTGNIKNKRAKVASGDVRSLV